MAIVENGINAKVYKGDHKPVNIYYGENKAAGWRSDSKSGESVDFSTTYNDVADVVVEGNTVQQSDWYAKDGSLSQSYMLDKSLSFDGVNDVVTITHNDALNLVGSGTISFWIKRKGSTGTYETIIAKRGSSCNYEVFLNTSNKRLGFYSGGSILTINYIPPIDSWVHIAVAVNESGSKFYINGTYHSSTSIKLGATNTTNLTIGTFSDEWYFGLVDEVAIWNYELSASEIANTYNKRLLGTETGLVGYWYFNEGVGTTVKDLAKGNNGTISGAIWSTDYAPKINDIVNPDYPSTLVANLAAGTYKYTSTDGIYEFTLPEELRGIGSTVDKVVFDRVSHKGYLERVVSKKVYASTDIMDVVSVSNIDLFRFFKPTDYIGYNDTTNAINKALFSKGKVISYLNDISSDNKFASTSSTTFSFMKTKGELSLAQAQALVGENICMYLLKTPTRTPLTFTKVSSSSRTEVPMSFLTSTPSLDYPAQVFDVSGNVISRGKNLFNYINYFSGTVVQIANGYRITGYANYLQQSVILSSLLKPNTTYTLGRTLSVSTGSATGAVSQIAFRRSSDGKMIFYGDGALGYRSYTFTTPFDISTYDRLYIYGSSTGGSVVEITNIQLEEGSAATSYEPYTGRINNTLPTLRKVGTVADTYNPATGVLTKNISDWITLDGSKNWIWHRDGALRYVLRFLLSNPCMPNYSTTLKYNSISLPTVTPNQYMLGDEVAIDNTNGIQVGVLHEDTGFYPNMIPTNGDMKAYFYGWKMCNADGTSPYYKSEVPYTPSTWSEWNIVSGTVTKDSTGAEFTATGAWSVLYMGSRAFKTSTKYGFLFNVISTTSTGEFYVDDTACAFPKTKLFDSSTTGNKKQIITSSASPLGNGLGLCLNSTEPVGNKIKIKDIRVFELPTGSQIEADFTNLTADQLAAKYTFNGLCVKNWKKITDGTGLTSTLPTASYEGYTPYKMLYQLATPVETNLGAAALPTYYPYTKIETDATIAKPTLNVSAKIEE